MDNPNIKLSFIRPDADSDLEIPLAADRVSAGFPSPAEGMMEPSLDLNRSLVRNPASTFYVRVSGDSMRDDCIFDGDLLVVDKAVEPYDGCVAVCFLDGDFTLKRVRMGEGKVTLMPSNKHYKPIEVSPDDDFSVWGVVTFAIKKI